MNIVLFPDRGDRRPAALSHPHPAVQREAARIERWLQRAQAGLAELAGVELEDQKALRRLADELLERLVD